MIRRPPRSTPFPYAPLFRSICYGGSMVRRMGGETLLHRTISRALAAEVLEWAAQRDLHARVFVDGRIITSPRSEEHKFELQSRQYIVCRLLLEKTKVDHWHV